MNTQMDASLQIVRKHGKIARRQAPATIGDPYTCIRVPSSSGPAPVGAPYQVALAASQLGSAVKAEALKLTGRAHEPYVTRSENISSAAVSEATFAAIMADAILLARQLALLQAKSDKLASLRG
jgi:hypothetical protein